MIIRIDGREIEVTDPNKNIVEIADDNGLSISAPCYRSKVRKGCCKGCAIMVNGTLKYACCTRPTRNMDIKINTEELKNLRKKNILKYKEDLKYGKVAPCNCGCSCSCGDDCC